MLRNYRMEGVSYKVRDHLANSGIIWLTDKTVALSLGTLPTHPTLCSHLESPGGSLSELMVFVLSSALERPQICPKLSPGTPISIQSSPIVLALFLLF